MCVYFYGVINNKILYKNEFSVFSDKKVRLPFKCFEAKDNGGYEDVWIRNFLFFQQRLVLFSQLRDII